MLALRYYQDLTVQDIAERTGVRPGTVKSRIHYALQALGVELGHDVAEDDR